MGGNHKEGQMNRFSKIAGSLVLVFVASACGSGENPAITSTAKPSPGAQAEHQNIGGTDALVRGRETVEGVSVGIEVDDNYFKPNILKGEAGAKVTLTLKSEGKALHNFSLTEQGVSQEIPPGTSQSVTVTFPQSGKLVFFCKYHRDEAQMVGELEGP